MLNSPSNIPEIPANVHSKSLLPHVLAAYDVGLSPVPAKEDGSKAPDVGRWKSLQKVRLNRGFLESEFSNGRTGMGLICGQVSGNLETLEFDDFPTYQAFLERANVCGLEDLVQRIKAGYCEQSPSSGIHWPYHCTEIGGNTKLASRPKLPEEKLHPKDDIKTLIETRGEGGFVVTAPSYGKVHPTGKPYVLLSGGFNTITNITPEERNSLFELARSFDQTLTQEKIGHVGHAGHIGHVDRGSRIENLSLPGDDFNKRGDWGDILHPHGWEAVYEQSGEIYWRRPGKSEGISATTNYAGTDLLYVFSTNTSLPAPRAYTKFAVYSLLDHNGDFRAAADTLSRLGYGTNTNPSENCHKMNWHT
jgi:putative DNA primase/helicase